MAGLFRYIPNRGISWDIALRMLGRFFNAASRSAADPHTAAGKAALRRMAGEFFDIAGALGILTGEMHLALASAPPEEPDFFPETIIADDVDAWVDGAHRYVDAIFADIAKRLEVMPGGFPTGIQNQLGTLIRESGDIRGQLSGIRHLAADNVRK